ncbi:MAG: HDOD domain-containing protein [Planctomycetaceae bacterium]|nr:HDOD domain-containing protein [Planctomycetaceae bacterium]
MADLPGRLVIPRPPKSITTFLEIAKSTASDLRTLIEIIERDTELSSQVLRLINSSAYGLNQKVASIPRASTLLGHRRCRMLLMSAALTASMRSVNSIDKSDGDFLSRSLERAVFARVTAETLGVDPEAAYVGALLQDLLLPHLQRAYPNKYDHFASSEQSLSILEQEHFGWNHATMAAKVLTSWSFPIEVVCCVAFHHDLDLIVSNDGYRDCGLIAPAISALLPDVFRQEPEGVRRLFQLQDTVPELRFIEIAAEVDEEFHQLGPMSSHRISLCDHLSHLAMTLIEHDRSQTNWLGRTIGQYTLEKKIGAGSMGEVYRARHSMLRRPAAVKLMAMSHLSSETLVRFEKEAHITSELSSPHTVQVYDYGATPEGVLFYVMEYLDGMTLRRMVEEYGPLPEGRVIHILSQICGSLAEAHGKGLIHRDVKPDNVLVSVCGGVSDVAKLLDFGLVEVVGGAGSPSSGKHLQGTPLYMAPEAIVDPEKIDERTDVYALGAVGYYLLSGVPLFSETKVVDVLQLQVTHDPPSPSQRSGREIAEDLEALVMQCLRKNANERPHNVMSVAEKLSRCRSANGWSFDDAHRWWSQHVTPASTTTASWSEPPGSKVTQDELVSTIHINTDT